jgi:elongation factor G
MTPAPLDQPLRPAAADRARFDRALAELGAGGSVARIGATDAAGWTVIGVADEDAVGAVMRALRDAHGLKIEMGPPQVAYRETVTRPVTYEYTHKRGDPPAREFARLKLLVEPGHAGSGFVFLNGIAASDVPAPFVASIEHAVHAAMEHGVLVGFPVIDVRVALIDAHWHKTDSSGAAFEAAATQAVQEALRMADAVLLEPIMALTITVDEARGPAMMHDIRSRRGVFTGAGTPGKNLGTVTWQAHVPFANLFGHLREFARMPPAAGTR